MGMPASSAQQFFRFGKAKGIATRFIHGSPSFWFLLPLISWDKTQNQIKMVW